MLRVISNNPVANLVTLIKINKRNNPKGQKSVTHSL